MKKIPTLFERVFEGHRIVEVLPNVTAGFEWVLKGEGIATLKIDGACCAIIDGMFYRRYDAKHGKPVPLDAIKCQEEADPVTGHLPCWIQCERGNHADKWFWEAYDASLFLRNINGTYEAVGKHFQNNPYNMDRDILLPHGETSVDVERTFDGIRTWLQTNHQEGIVFWKDGQPQCKIKRSDFGFEWK